MPLIPPSDAADVPVDLSRCPVCLQWIEPNDAENTSFTNRIYHRPCLEAKLSALQPRD